MPNIIFNRQSSIVPFDKRSTEFMPKAHGTERRSVIESAEMTDKPISVFLER